MATRRLSGLTTSSSVPDNGGDHSGGGGSAGGYLDDVFSTYLYEGAGADQDIVNGVDLDGEGGMVWIKCRSVPYDHYLFDTDRGVNNYLNSNGAGAENAYSVVSDLLTSFNSNGFSFGADSLGSINVNNQDYASWTFRKAPNFFDVVTYTGTSPDTQEVPHNLGSTPGVIICKSRTNGSADWGVWHKDLDDGYYLRLNVNNAASRGDGNFPVPPTDEVFSVGTATNTNEAGGEYVAYLFAHDDSDESMIKCGSYTGNGNADGPEIDLGWEPQYVLLKNADSASDWYVYDTMRGITTGGNSPSLTVNKADTERTFSQPLMVTPTGFKLTNGAGGLNQSGDDYIFMAIRRPNKPASEFEPEELFAMDDYLGTNPVEKLVPSGFPVDMSMIKNYEATDRRMLFTRLLGDDTYLRPDARDPSTAITGFRSDANEGVYVNGTTANLNATVQRNIAHMWRRAPGFFDVVTYNGDSSNPISHNLGVAPELIITKEYAHIWDWYVWGSALGDNQYINLNSDNAATKYTFNTTVTDKTFMSGISSSNQPTVAYLFASVPGICDIGSYTATNVNEDIDCGFTNGARFVLIKRTDASGDWMYWDAERGINIFSQKSPMLKLNETDAQVLNGYIMPFSGGFRVNSGDPAAIDGGSYIYMAIA